MRKISKLVIGSILSLIFVIFGSLNTFAFSNRESYDSLFMVSGNSSSLVNIGDSSYYCVSCIFVNELYDPNSNDGAFVSVYGSELAEMYLYFPDDPFNSEVFSFGLLIVVNCNNSNGRFIVNYYTTLTIFINSNEDYREHLGYEDGYDYGFDIGSEDGWADGYEYGNYLGFENGYYSGYSEGKTYSDNNVNINSASYQAGYNQGLLDGDNSDNDNFANFTNLLSAIFMFPIRFFTEGLDVNIFGINLGDLFLGIFMLGIMLTLIDKIRGVRS